MGRHEAPVDNTVPARGRLAERLRELRDNANLSNQQLAEAMGVEISTVRRAASGCSVPRRQLVVAWCKAVATIPSGVCYWQWLWSEEIRLLWAEARYQDRLASSGRKPVALPQPELVHSAALLSTALVELYERGGAPPYAEVEENAVFGLLPHSTVHRIIRRQTLPATEEQCRAFLLACDVRRPQRWVDAWKRVVGAAAQTAKRAPYTPSPAYEQQLLTRRETRLTPGGSRRTPKPQRELRGDGLFDAAALQALVRPQHRMSRVQGATRPALIPTTLLAAVGSA